ncbi:MAG: hypothetical protein JNL81_09670 [Hyphomonadaceae bacterium]|nr:hypothetical protein [Hyphomonadaceae bacterium]
MFTRVLGLAAPFAMIAANAYAAAAPAEEDEGFPLAIVFALIAVACGVGTAIFASQQKKKD